MGVHKSWTISKNWRRRADSLTKSDRPISLGLRKEAQKADDEVGSAQLFVSLIPPLVVETLRSRPPAPTVPESRFELKLP